MPEGSFYIAGAIISILCWVAALVRAPRIFSGPTQLLIGKILMILTLMIMDMIIIFGFLDLLNTEQFRLGMSFLTGVQIIAALSVVTVRENRINGNKK